jgi:ADP-heptose:LPS heptosyltransferase
VAATVPKELPLQGTHIPQGPDRRRTGRDGPAVLLCRPDHLGDVVLTLPAAMFLRALLPDARLTYVVHSSLAPLTQRCPAVDDTIGLPFAGPQAPELTQDVWHAARPHLSKLRDHDAALLLRPDDPVSGELTRRAGVPARIGFPQPGTAPHLTLAVTEPREHVAALGFHLVRALLAEVGGAYPSGWEPPTALPEILRERERLGPALRTMEEDEARAQELLDDVAGEAGPAPVVMHPGTGWRLKSWSAASWAELGRRIFSRFGIKPLITGTAGEEGLVAGIAGRSPRCCLPVAGRLSLGAFAALLRRSCLLVALDSGPLHLAALLGTPVAGLYGPESAERAGPLAPPGQVRTLGVFLRCRPCGRMTDPPCGAATEPDCLTGIPVDAVWEAVEALLPGFFRDRSERPYTDSPDDEGGSREGMKE